MIQVTPGHMIVTLATVSSVDTVATWALHCTR